MPRVERQSPTTTKKSGVLGRIKPDVEVKCNLKMAIYGRSGSGKTSLAGTFPKPLLRIRSPNEAKRKSVLIKGADVADPTTLAELREISDYQRSSGKYVTIVMDNATDFQDMALKQVLGVNEIPAQLGWGVASQQQWGEVGLLMKELLRDYISELQCNILILAQEREFNTEGSNEILAPYVNCALSPSVAGFVGPSVDYLCQTFLRVGKKIVIKKIGGKEVKTTTEGGVEFCLRTGAHPVYSTKFTVARGVEVPEIIVNPDYTKIMKVINGQAEV